MKKIKYIDLFAGIGGIRLGLEQSLKEKNIESECVFTSEIKPHAISVYKENFPNTTIYGDIKQIKSSDIPDFDILLAGFPCQPFSSAGRRKGFADIRGTLFFEIARILKDKKPRYFLLENVENLIIHDLSKEDKENGEQIGNTFKTILNVLEKELDYTVSWKVLQASDFGVAQIRRRIFIVGSKDKKINLDNFIKTHKSFGEIQEHIEFEQDDFAQKICDYLTQNNLPISYLYDKSIRDKRGQENNLHSWNLNLRGETTQEQRELMDALFENRKKKELAEKKGVPLKDGVGLDISELQSLYKGKTFINDVISLYNMGYIKKYKIPEYNQNLYDIKCGRLSFPYTKFIDPNKPCLTLVATDATHLGIIDGNKIRKLTIRECLRLNGFPEDFTMDSVNYNKSIDLLGNTVVVPVIKAICDRIFE